MSFPNSSLPPSGGEVRWEVRRPARPPTLSNTPITHPLPPQLSPTAHPHSPQLRLSLPQNRSAEPCLSPRNNADAHPTPPPSTPLSTPAVNPRCQPLRRIPNKPEQIRTDPNKPEHRRTPRPDKDTPRIAPEHPKKNNPEHRRCPPAASHTTSLPQNSSLPPSRGETKRGVGRHECAMRVARELPPPPSSPPEEGGGTGKANRARGQRRTRRNTSDKCGTTDLSLPQNSGPGAYAGVSKPLAWRRQARKNGRRNRGA